MKLSTRRLLLAAITTLWLEAQVVRAADLSEEFSALSADIKAASQQLSRHLNRAAAGQSPLLGDVFDAFIPIELQMQIRADLAFIQAVQGNEASPLHQQVFGPVNGLAYLQFFTSRVKAISLDSSDDPGGMVYMRPFVDHPKMFLTPNYTKFNPPQIARLMLLFQGSPAAHL